MELNVRVEAEKMTLAVGKGFCDFVWLACYAAKMYGRVVYPKGNYLPLLLQLEQQGVTYTPHPRKRICQFIQQMSLKPALLTVIVTIRKANQTFSALEEKWQRQAFSQERNLMQLRFKYFADKLNRKKQFYFAVEIVYNMHEEVKHLYDETEYRPVQEFQMREKQVGTTSSQFETQLTLPLGSIKHTLLYYSKEDKNEDWKCARLDETQLRQGKNSFTVLIQPYLSPLSEIQQKIREDMKIQENLAKELQERELDTKKKGTNNNLFCCYTFEQLWSAIQTYQKQLSLRKYEESTIERVKLTIQKHMAKLYEIFFYYFIIYNQQKQKKEDLVITYQDIMHLFKFYEILKDTQSISNFFDFYNHDNKIKNVSDTLDLNNGVTFPHFVSLLLKVTQFVQTSNLMLEGQTYDQSVTQLIEKVIKIESNDEQFGFFHWNLRQQTKLIAYIKEHCLQLANIFVERVQMSLHTVENSYNLVREDLKILLGDCQFKGNHDNLINQCFLEFFSKDKYRKFDGIYFYEFLQILQWLALVLIQGNKEDEDDEDPEEQVINLLEKMKFMLAQLAQRR